VSATGGRCLASYDLIDELGIGRIVELQIIELRMLVVALRVRYADFGRLVLGRGGENRRLLLLLIWIVKSQLALQIVPCL
jgi:hypothetical protein